MYGGGMRAHRWRTSAQTADSEMPAIDALALQVRGKNRCASLRCGAMRRFGSTTRGERGKKRDGECEPIHSVHFCVTCLDEQLLDLILDGVELRLDLRLLVGQDGARDHAARHTAGTAQGGARRNEHVRHVLTTERKQGNKQKYVSNHRQKETHAKRRARACRCCERL